MKKIDPPKIWKYEVISIGKIEGEGEQELSENGDVAACMANT